MSALQRAAVNRNERGVSGIGDEHCGVMNEVDANYLDRQQESYADISDYQGNIYTVSFGLLASVGVDVSRQQIEISPEQLNEILSSMAPIEEGMAGGSEKLAEYEEEPRGDQLVISILEDGDIKLVSAGGGPASYFSSSQLAEVNIDTQNLTDEDIKRIVQLAGAASGQFNYDESGKPDKRRKLEGGQDETRMQSMQRNYQNIQPSHSAASTSFGLAPGPSNNPAARRVISNGGRTRQSMPNGLIGESVKIVNAKGKTVTAVVRYSRAGIGYKVQTGDGKFEWVSPDRIIDRVPHQEIKDYDHKGYTSDPPASSNMAVAPSTSSGGGPMLPRRVFASSSSGGGTQRALPSIIRRLPAAAAAGHHQHQQHQHHQHAPNFCCPVCDRKVYQKEPAYIVIRLPACDSCTREKILIVDDDPQAVTSSTLMGGEAGPSARPSTRSIATDTDDLEMKKDEEKASEEDHSTTSPEESPGAADEEQKSVEEEDATAVPTLSAMPLS